MFPIEYQRYFVSSGEGDVEILVLKMMRKRYLIAGLWLSKGIINNSNNAGIFLFEACLSSYFQNAARQIT